MKVTLRNRIVLSLCPLIILFLGLTYYLFHETVVLYRTTEDLMVHGDEFSRKISDANVRLTVLNLLLNESSYLSLPDGLTHVSRLLDDLAASVPITDRYINMHDNFSVIENTQKFSQTLVSFGGAELKAELNRGNIASLQKKTVEALASVVSLQNQLQAFNEQERFRLGRRLLVARASLIIGIILAILLILIYSVMSWRRIVRPIIDISDQMEHLGRTGVLPTLCYEQNDEIGHLAKTFYRMAHRLDEYKKLCDNRVFRSTSAFRTVLENSPDAFFILTINFEPIYANPRAEYLIENASLMSDPPAEVNEIFRKTLDTGKPQIQEDIEVAISFRVGHKERWFLVNAFPINALPSTENLDPTSEHDFHWVAAVFQDVTIQKLSESLRKNVLATVSHELKTPLTSARMSIYLLLEQQVGSLNLNQIELLETAREDLNRQLGMIENLLDVSRVEQDARIIRYDRFNLVTVGKECVAAHREFAKSYKVTLELMVPWDEVIVQADRHKLGVVLNNLIVNAIKHSFPGEAVRIEITRGEKTVRITVVDRGEGLSDENLETIFQVKGAVISRQVDGSGMGLKISKTIIEAHRGQMGCSSKKDVGSSFFFEIPIEANLVT